MCVEQAKPEARPTLCKTGHFSVNMPTLFGMAQVHSVTCMDYRPGSVPICEDQAYSVGWATLCGVGLVGVDC